MPRKNQSKKGKETQASSSSALPQPATVIERPATPNGYATQGQRRPPFGERKYDSDCGPESEWQPADEDENDYGSEDNEHFHAVEHNHEMDPCGVITEFVNESLQTKKEKFEESLHKLGKDMCTKIARRCNFGEYKKRIDKTVNKVDTKPVFSTVPSEILPGRTGRLRALYEALRNVDDPKQ
ncbi:hypothetical protein BDD12DRAFT_482659 [Trichophaea hybrida]|nr:hypothetical protein BDD12DRAFT_482659 [Trichophaea hybrida]